MQDLNGWWLKVNSKENQIRETAISVVLSAVKGLVDDEKLVKRIEKVILEKIDKINTQSLDRLEKLEKIIDILKDKFFIDLIERQEDGKLGFVPINPIENQPRFAEITKEEYELLKEVLDDEK